VFKFKIIIRSPDEVERQSNLFHSSLRAARLDTATNSLVAEQVDTTLRQFGKQMALSTTRSFAADRVIEGNGYFITIRARNREETFVTKMKELLGF
jgi:hypothetical protein